MDKLLDFKKGKIIDDCKMYRFQCDCLLNGDAMDIFVEKNGNEKYLILCLDFYSHSFWSRLKYAFEIIRGHWSWREFMPRKEDYGNLSDIFNPEKEYDELP